MLDRVLTIKTEKPLLDVQKVVSAVEKIGKPLEPATYLVAYGPNGKVLPLFLPLWRRVRGNGTFCYA